MNTNRRTFLSSLTMGTLAASTSFTKEQDLPRDELIQAPMGPILKTDDFTSPIILESVDLLHKEGQYLVRVRSKDGAEGVIITNDHRLRYLYPIFLQCVAPYFVGKDARNLDELIDGVFVYRSNYKLQGLALWVCVASIEMAILELLGRISGKSVGNLIGQLTRDHVHIYRASGNRGNTAEEEVEALKRLVEQTGAEAIKFKVGGRMSNNRDSRPGRSEKLIPLAREALGDEMIIYVDSNGSYDVNHSIRIGKICEKNNLAFFEEPCPFDHLWETKAIADALDIPIAGGEQESSLRRFRWMIQKNALQIVQPDLFYFGGFLRCIRVARMAEKAGMTIIPHMSGAGLGYLYVILFAACIPNAGKYMEYKGKTEKVPISCETSSLSPQEGKIKVPTGPGFGVNIDPEYIQSTEKL